MASEYEKYQRKLAARQAQNRAPAQKLESEPAVKTVEQNQSKGPPRRRH